MGDERCRTDPPAPEGAGGVSRTDLGMLLVVLIWGANFAIVKAAFAHLAPLAFTAARFAAASLLIVPVVYLREGAPRAPRRSFWKLVGLGLVGNTLYQLLFVIGLSQTTAANSALLIAATPVLVALLGALLRVERLTRHVLAGIALAFCGITLVVAARGAAVSLATLRGDLLVLGATFCWALYTLGVRALGRGLSPLGITAMTMWTGTPGLVIAGLPQLARADWGGVGWRVWGALAYSAVLSLVFAYAIWNTSVRAVGSSRTAVYACVTPLVAATVAWPLLGEQPRPLQAVGAGLIIAGVLLTRRRAKDEGAPARVGEEIHVSG
jgi:drug/metabolite transporter (DMT)-like permease